MSGLKVLAVTKDGHIGKSGSIKKHDLTLWLHKSVFQFLIWYSLKRKHNLS